MSVSSLGCEDQPLHLPPFPKADRILTYNLQAKPVSKHATDPMKVSHHIHRIGYHFKSEIVTNACIELGYIVHRQQFVKEADLQTKKDHSKLAEIMARRGMTLNQLEMRESPEQVRAAIKELFPKIPDEDLNQIVDHAWKEGSHRVGTNANLQLPRRVQLATIARIRHTYTDYDQLLRAFEWKDARAMVEQACLLKVIEWRGEHDEANDNDLEEIVREIIVLDDDDDENSDAYDEDEADDEDSDAELGFMSDSSVEITHTRLLGKDLTAENMNEGHGTNPYQQPPPPRRRVQQNAMALQRITQTRQQIQTSNVPPQVPPYAQQRIYSPLSLQMKTYSMRDAPNQMTIGGQIFRRVRALPCIQDAFIAGSVSLTCRLVGAGPQRTSEAVDVRGKHGRAASIRPGPRSKSRRIRFLPTSRIRLSKTIGVHRSRRTARAPRYHGRLFDLRRSPVLERTLPCRAP